MSVSIGDQAPEFELPGTPENPVKLSDYRGEKNVVLLFFPLAWTPVCSNEMDHMRDNYEKYADLDAEILAVSVDSPFALKAWNAEQNFGFPLLSDFNRDVTNSYGPLTTDLATLKDVSKRAAFVIDKQGVVRHAEVCPSLGDLPDFDALEKSLAELG
jgi:peroxiredoxin